MSIVRKICFSLFLLISFIYILIVVCPSVFNNFYPFGIRTAIVLTGSMEPTIEIDDLVIIKKPNDIKVNDIVSYEENGISKEVIHRVVSVNNGEIVTRGDANNTDDKPIKESQITGVYVGRIRYLGKILRFINKPAVFSTVITFFAILMFIPIKDKNVE